VIYVNSNNIIRFNIFQYIMGGWIVMKNKEKNIYKEFRRRMEKKYPVPENMKGKNQTLICIPRVEYAWDLTKDDQSSGRG